MIFQRRIHATDDELSAYLDGRLSAGVRERVGSHVDGCAICQQALDGLRAVQTSLRGLRAKAPRSFAREPAARPVRAPGGFDPVMRLLSGVTAMAMLALFVVVGIDMSGGGSSSNAGTSAQPAALLGFVPSVGTASAADAAQSLTVTVASGSVSQGAVGTPLQATPEAVTFTGATPETALAPAAAGTSSLGDTTFGVEKSQRLTVTASGAALNRTSAPPEATPGLAKRVSSGTDSDTRMHVAAVALAAVALVSGGSAVAVARRRRST